jgi:hypothetical protein
MRLLLFLSLALAAMAACSSEKERSITVDDLDALVLGVEDTAFQNLGLDRGGSGELSNTQLVAFNDTEPEHQAYIERLITTSRRLTGYGRGYAPRTPSLTANGPLYFRQFLDLYPDDKGAQAFLRGLDSEPSNKGRRDNDGLGEVITDEGFEASGIGDESAGRQTVVQEGPEARIYQTQLAFRRGRLVGLVAVVYPDNRDAREEVRAIAQKFDQRVKEFLGE